MYNSGSGWGVLLQCVDVGHNVVSTTTLFISRHLKCFVANDEVRSNGIDCFAADLSNTELLFCLGKPEPEFSRAKSIFS